MHIKAIQLDLARQKETLEFIKEFAEFAKTCGYNTLFLYLEGRVKTASFPYKTAEESYSREELQEIVTHCLGLGIEIIPCVSTLGHTEQFLQHKELQPLGELDGGVEGRWLKKGYYNQVCPSRQATYDFFETYLREVSEIFPSTYFHVGMDECWELGLCPECRQTHDAVEGYAPLFAAHLKRIHKILKTLKKRLLMWSDMFAVYPAALKQIPRDIIMCMWCYDFNATTMVDHISRSREVYDSYEEYDRLGFDYLTCPVATHPQNILGQTRYARTHKPLGGLLTQWEKTTRFYQSSYPLIALAGDLWNKKSSAKINDATALADSLQQVGISDPKISQVVLAAMTIKQPFIAKREQNCFLGEMTQVEEESLAALEAILVTLAPFMDDDKNPVLQDIALTALEGKIHRQTRKYFYEAAMQKFFPEVATWAINKKALLAEISRFRELRLMQWKRYRQDLSTTAFQEYFSELLSDIRGIAPTLQAKTHLLKLRLFLPEVSGTPCLTIRVDGEILKENSQLKPGGEETAYYTYFLPFCGKKSPKKITLEYIGCGGQGITYAAIMTPTGEYVPQGICGSEGRVFNPQGILCDNRQWCYLGEQEAKQMFFWNEYRKVKSAVTFSLKKK